MRQEILYTLDTPYRQSLSVEGFRFGRGQKCCAIVGALRGNEIQQMYTCSLLVRELKRLEQQGAINKNREILVIPCVNHFSMNVGSRFWSVDNTDINRMFPGYDKGETTQRIAQALFSAVQGYDYGIHFTSFYIQGEFVPHVRIMHTGYENPNLAGLFGLPYVLIRNPKPYDTTTLNYNWQIWNTNAFSIYSLESDDISTPNAEMSVSAVLRFLSRVGALRYPCHNGYMSVTLQEDHLANVHTTCGGIFHRLKVVGENVQYGEVIGEILDPLTAEVKEQLIAPTSGTLFFAAKNPLITQHAEAYRIIRRLHT